MGVAAGPRGRSGHPSPRRVWPAGDAFRRSPDKDFHPARICRQSPNTGTSWWQTCLPLHAADQDTARALSGASDGLCRSDHSTSKAGTSNRFANLTGGGALPSTIGHYRARRGQAPAPDKAMGWMQSAGPMADLPVDRRCGIEAVERMGDVGRCQHFTGSVETHFQSAQQSGCRLTFVVGECAAELCQSSFPAQTHIILEGIVGAHLHIIDGGIRRPADHLVAAPSRNGDSKWPILQDWTFP